MPMVLDIIILFASKVFRLAQGENTCFKLSLDRGEVVGMGLSLVLAVAHCKCLLFCVLLVFLFCFSYCSQVIGSSFTHISTEIGWLG